MLKKEVERGPGGSILIMDSITKVAPEDAGAIVVTYALMGPDLNTVRLGPFALRY